MASISFSYAITDFDLSDSSGSFHRDPELALQYIARSKHTALVLKRRHVQRRVSA
jgi:hypothetical protein